MFYQILLQTFRIERKTQSAFGAYHPLTVKRPPYDPTLTKQHRHSPQKTIVESKINLRLYVVSTVKTSPVLKTFNPTIDPDEQI